MSDIDGTITRSDVFGQVFIVVDGGGGGCFCSPFINISIITNLPII